MSATYRLHGLTVRSEIPLDALADEAAGADLAVRRGRRRPIADAPPPGRLLALLELTGGSWSIAFDGSRFTVRIHSLCDFDLDPALGSVSVHLDPEADEELASLFLGGALAALLSLRGHCVLHASAVTDGAAAVAFVAGSGRGKTTVAALCCAAGAGLVSDDVLRVECDGGVAWCHRGSTELRLRANASELAAQVGAGVERLTIDQRTAVRPVLASGGRLPLAAVVVPICMHGRSELRIERLRGRQALLELIRYPRTLGWTQPEVTRRDFDVLARIAGAVPVYQAHLPWGPPFEDDLGARLLSRVTAAAVA